MKRVEKTSIYAFLSTHLKAITNVELIHAGESTLSYKVTTDNGIYFAKNIADSSTKEIEQQCCNVAAKAKISPKHYLVENSVLIAEFIEEADLQTKNIPLKNKISIAIKLMCQFHQLSLELPVLNISAVLLNLCAHQFYHNEQLSLLTKIITQLSNSINVRGSYPCHGDANFANILTTENNDINYLIDFECACLADIEYDIAMFLAINCIPKKYHHDVFNYYQYYDNTFKVNTLLVKQYLCVAHLINGLWYFNQAVKKEANKTIFQRKAMLHFSFFDQYSIENYALADKMR